MRLCDDPQDLLLAPCGCGRHDRNRWPDAARGRPTGRPGPGDRGRAAGRGIRAAPGRQDTRGPEALR